MYLTGKNISFPIYYKVNNYMDAPFHNLVLHKAVVDSVVMSLGDKITGDVYYVDRNLQCTMTEYVMFDGVKYTIVNPPTLVKEGMVSDNSDLKGMCKYSFEFYHPMYILGNLPFSDVAVSYDEMRYKSQDKTFSWIGKPADFVAKLNKNLDSTEWVVVLSDNFPQDKVNELSGVLSFDNNTIADALKTAYDTWGVPFVVDVLHEGEHFDEHNNDYYSESGGYKRYLITIGVSSNEILDPDSEYGTIVHTTTLLSAESAIYYNPTTPITVTSGRKIILESLTDGVTPIILNSSHSGVIGTSNKTFNENTTIYIGSFNGVGDIRYFFEGEEGNVFVFKYGQGVGLKNHSRTPRNNKIITRIAGYGSENNIPYGYPQIRWYGDPNATCTIGDSVGAKQNVRINGVLYDWAMSYPIYDGIVGGEWVKLIKHPFTRNHLMPTIYAESVFNKVSQFLPNGTANRDFNPNLEIKDYYDAVSDSNYTYPNPINPIAPSYEIHQFEDIKPELGEEHILDAIPINSDLTEAEEWDDTMDDNGNYLQSYFKITLPQLDFDIYACAAITEEMQINMRSGACIGCTFTVQVDWEDYKLNFYDSEMNFAPDGQQRNYEKYPDSSQGSISVIVQKDINTFGTLMPNIYQYPHAGDAFVVLGISLPISYIENAQERLDDAMKSYMFENNVYYFDYPLKFDEHFLAKNVAILNQIRPNTIVRFEFGDEELQLYIKQLTIKFNESPLPQYDITLTDNVEVILNSIGQVADDVSHLGSLISTLRQQFGKNVYVELAKKLSKVESDTAQGLITFLRGFETGQYIQGGFLGAGAKVDEYGRGEFEEITVRGAMRAAELVFNLISAEEGESIRSIGHGEIESVVPDYRHGQGVATLKLEGHEWATIKQGDICRGLYNTIGDEDLYDDNNADGFDDNGFRKQKGFFSSYFVVDSVLVNERGNCQFRYMLQSEPDQPQNILTNHPCELMKFAVYGNIYSSEKERQSSIYTTAVGIAPRILFLAGVNTWQIKPENIKIAFGNINGLSAWERVTESEYQEFEGTEGVDKIHTTEVVDGETIDKYIILKPLVGDAGFYCEDNIYLGGIIDQFKAAAIDAITSEISNLGQAWIETNLDKYVVDCDGDGKILDSHQFTITASLYYGNEKCELSDQSGSCYIRGLGSAVGSKTSSDTFAREIIIDDFTTPFSSETLTVYLTGTLNGNTYTMSKSIMIVANRQGKQGQQGDSVGGYSAYLTKSSDSIVIDGDGNIIGGLGLNRLSTEVKIWDAANSRYLVYTGDRLSDGKFNYTTKAVNCQVSVGLKGEIVIDSITDKTMNSCGVSITARTYDNVLYNFVYTVSLAHIDQSYLTFDLDNEYDSIAYRTQTHRYDGLPLSATLKCYANDVEHVDEGVTYGNVRLYDSLSGYINKVVVTSDLFSGSVTALPRKQYNQETSELIGITHINETAIIIRDENNADTGLRLVVNSGGTVTLRHYRTSGDEIDLPDTKHWIDISCEVIYGGVTYVSPTKRMTIAEVTDSTIYRLMLSATAISQEESTYTPSTIDVKASVTDESGTTIYSMVGSDPSDHLEADGVALANRNIKIRYINGVYNPNGVNTLLSVCPQFANLTDKVLTVVLVDLTDLSSPVYLDIQTVTINSGGKDGAGQSWINASHDQFVVDCDEYGRPISTGLRSVRIVVSLRWGDENCRIASTDDVTMEYVTPSGKVPVMTAIELSGSNGVYYSAYRTITFNTISSGGGYNSGYLNVTIKGTSQDGVEHNATKTIPFIINRRGMIGSMIDTITTYYLITDKASGVTTEDIGWVDYFIEPTAEHPYLWRYSRYTYTDGTSIDTNCELVSVYSDRPNINLLDDTYFGSIEAMDAWTQKGELNRYLVAPVRHEVSASNGTYQVIFQGYQGTGGENGNIEYLTQPVYAPNIEKIRPNSWYTLSFWLYGSATQEGALPTSKSFYLNLDMTGLFNNEYPRYVDGVESPNANVLVQFIPDNTWTLHTVTFKTPSALSGTVNVRFIMQTMYIYQYIQMKSPKLEIGMVATDYVNGNVSRQPMARTSKWEAGKQYYKGVVGERYIDIVSVNGKWYQCLRSHLSSDENKPQQDTETAYWSPANNFNFIATSLLLADTGVINLLFGNAIYMRDKQDRLTASLNEEGTGSYIIYYPESGNKLMQFGSDGYIRFYNDDAGNTEQWRLGFGGDIKSGTSDDWKPKMLYKLASNTPNFTADTVFNRTMYFEFRSAIGGQFGAFDHGFFSSHNTDNPTNETAAVSGWYTPDPMPWHKIDDDGDTMNYGITMYHIVRENVTIGTTTYKVAKISGTQRRIFDGTNYINED